MFAQRGAVVVGNRDQRNAVRRVQQGGMHYPKLLHLQPGRGAPRKQRAIKFTYDILAEKWQQQETMVTLAERPFAEGGMRYCLKMREYPPTSTMARSNSDHRASRDGVPMVAKIFISRKDRVLDDSTYFHEAMTQTVSASFAEQFNAHAARLNASYWCEFMPVGVMQLVESGGAIVCCEPYMGGAFVKHNDNDGNIETEYELPQAFSHYTWAASCGQILVCDIQGVNNIFTDPQIHSKDGFSFGQGNMGTEGIDAFLTTHKCNAICRHLELAAPQKSVMGGWSPPAPLQKAARSGWGITSKIYDGAMGNAMQATRMKAGKNDHVLDERLLIELMDAASEMGSEDGDMGYSPKAGNSPMRGNSPLQGNSPLRGNSPIRVRDSPLGSPFGSLGSSPHTAAAAKRPLPQFLKWTGEDGSGRGGLKAQMHKGSWDDLQRALSRGDSSDSGSRSSPDHSGRQSPIAGKTSPLVALGGARKALGSPGGGTGEKQQGSGGWKDGVGRMLSNVFGGSQAKLSGAEVTTAECRHCSIEGPAAVIKVNGPHHARGCERYMVDDGLLLQVLQNPGKDDKLSAEEQKVKEIRIKMQMLQAQLELSRAVGGSQAAASQAGDGPRWQIKSVGGQWCDLLDDQIVQLNEAQVGGHRTVQLQGLGVVHFDKLVLVSSQTGQKFSLRES